MIALPKGACSATWKIFRVATLRIREHCNSRQNHEENFLCPPVLRIVGGLKLEK